MGAVLGQEPPRAPGAVPVGARAAPSVGSGPRDSRPEGLCVVCPKPPQHPEPDAGLASRETAPQAGPGPGPEPLSQFDAPGRSLVAPPGGHRAPCSHLPAHVIVGPGYSLRCVLLIVLIGW